jgi:hypothetical protein
MKKRSFLALAIAALFIIPVSVYGVEYKQLFEPIANGGINWTTGIIQAKGMGVPPEKYYGKPNARPMAIRAAKRDAMRSLLEVTKGVRIDSSTTVQNFAVTNDVIIAKVYGLVKGAQVVDTQYMSDGTVEVTMHMSIYGAFAQVVLPMDIKKLEPIKTHTPPPPPPVKKPDTKPVDTGMESLSGVYTGLVVDARGLNARPAMSPKIVDETGKEVYGSAYVSREFAVQQGMSGYAKELTAAQKNQRVTDNPLTVKGMSTKGSGRSNIVISNADATKLRSASENLSFMKKCKVMIVVD